VRDFANLQYAKAEALLRALLPEIDRLPPGAERWNLSSLARSQLAQVVYFAERKDEAATIFLGLLRVEEGLRLDPLSAPPSLRSALVQVRNTTLRRARRFILHVTSIEPNQSVFLDGREVGQTPFARSFPEGGYELVVGLPNAHSFPRALELKTDTDIDVDVAREARLKADAGPCYESSAAQEDGYTSAALLGSAMSAEQVVAVHLSQRADGEYLVATLYQAGREVREGRLRSERGKLPSLKRLAEFVLTGAGLEEPSVPREPPLPAALPPSSVVQKPAQSLGRPVGYGLLGLGVATLVASGILFLEAAGSQRELNGLWAGDHYPKSAYASVSDATARRDRCRLWAQILGGVGIASGAAGGIVLWRAPSGTSVSVAPMVGGGVVSVRY
jgi:hypothetical protein